MKYKGRQLAPIPLIAIRMVLWPVAQILRALLCFVAFLGWGKDEAVDLWDKTA